MVLPIDYKTHEAIFIHVDGSDANMAYSKIRQPKLADVIEQRLEHLILDGTLSPGEKLPPERELAKQFDVSRPSLREAIQKLEAKGFLLRRQGGGTFVQSNLTRWPSCWKGIPNLSLICWKPVMPSRVLLPIMPHCGEPKRILSVSPTAIRRLPMPATPGMWKPNLRLSCNIS